jgi:hypothetical protein
MKLEKIISTAIVMSVMMVVLAGCQKPEGPAEHAGKEVDKTAEKAGQQIEKAGDNIQDASKGNK